MKLKLLADLIVLAKHTTQITAREKNRPRAFRAGDGRLFAKMQTGVRNPNLCADSASGELARDAVHAAFTRTTDAIGELISKRCVHNRGRV